MLMALALFWLCLLIAAPMVQGIFVPAAEIQQEHSMVTRRAAPYFLLEPVSFRKQLGSDFGWATENIPLFESANSTLDLVYYFRWRTYKSHIHPTNCSDVGGLARARNCQNRTDGELV